MHVKRVTGESPNSPGKLQVNISAHDHAIPAPFDVTDHEKKVNHDTHHHYHDHHRQDDDPNHPKLASDLFLKYVKVKNVPELNYHDFEYINHVADGGYGAVFRYRRKEDDKLVAMNFRPPRAWKF